MDNIKKIFDNPIAKRALIGLGVFFLIFIFIILIASCSNNKTYTYEELENKLLTIAKNYYTSKPDSLPKNNKDEVELSFQTMINEGKIKPFEEITEDKVSCSGEIKVINNNGYYLYIPNLNCGNKYTTSTLYDKLTNESNIKITGNGLYKETDKYVYKGDTVNNYLKINDTLFRMISLDEQGIKVLDLTRRDVSCWDNRYNSDPNINSNSGINNYVNNNINSIIKDELEKLYKDENTTSETIKPYFTTFTLCVGKRAEDDLTKNELTECSEKLENQIYGLLNVSEFYRASLDTNCNDQNLKSCMNYNYLADNNTWLVTADLNSTNKVYKINGGEIQLKTASIDSTFKTVATIDKNVIFNGGTGTQSDPYTIKMYN